MVDVSMIVEGTYPYLTGGVSTWIDRLIRGLPDVTFAVTHIRHGHSPVGPAVYDPPPNLVAVGELELDGERERPTADAHRALPDARVQHALSTGGASVLAAQAASEGRGRFLLTEHGLAWLEAALGIEAYKGGGGGGGGNNRGDGRVELHADRQPSAALRLARDAYRAADLVTSVCTPNARLQILLGAAAARTRVIPNGAPVSAPSEPPAAGVLWLGLVGRVVAVKDVQSFLRACALVAAQRSDVRFAVVGPLDHDPAYVERCLALAGRLGLGSRLVFTGATDPGPWYRRLDILCLTSVSEAAPLVLLEAMAVGLPVVATDVGGCAELVRPCGIVTESGAPRATADALLRLCADRELRERLGAAGRARAREGHDPDVVHGAYRRAYAELAA